MLILLLTESSGQINPYSGRFLLVGKDYMFKLDEDITYFDTLKLKIWQKGGLATITLSQISFTNWTAGGENSVSGIGNLTAFANRRRGKNTWDNNLEVAYGLLSQGGDFRKTDDRIDFTSLYNRFLKNEWYYSLMINFKTQILPGYDYPNDSVIISNFLAPAYLLTTMGIEFRPSKKLIMTIAPLSGKITIVADQNLANKGAFGVVEGTFNEILEIFETLGNNLKYELGAFAKFIYNGKLTDNLQLQTKADLFTGYNEKFGNIDINWELKARIKLTEIISMNIMTHLIYDDDVKMELDDRGNVVRGPRIQFKEMVGFGFTFMF